MEKRVFLAIALSLLILLAWQSFAVKTQPIEQQEVTQIAQSQSQSTETAITPSSQQATPPASLPQQFDENLVVKETEEFILTFSNIGGRIKQITLKDYDKKLFETDFGAVEDFENSPFVLSQSNDRVIYVYQDRGVKIVKTFTVPDQGFAIDLEISFINLSGNNIEQKYRIYNASIDFEQISPSEFSPRDKYFLEFSVSTPEKILRKNFARALKKEVIVFDHLDWVGVRDKYFCSILYPLSSISSGFIKPTGAQRVTSGLATTSFLLAYGENYDFNCRLYVGPQNTKILSSFDRGLENIVSFGTFDIISQGLLAIMRFFHSIIPNWGVCIILICLLVYLVLYPLTSKSLASMKKMQVLQPEIEKLRTAFKDQPQKLNKEIMELYRENKINPLGGCLPMFLQIPVFFALYQALMRSVELNGATFLWIKDLSEPDRLITLAKSYPVIGDAINILPLIMVVAMFFQQKLSMKSSGSSTMQEQQKMMMFMFPLLFGFLFYKFPSGLTLYWVSYTILSILSQRRISRLAEK
ncbi:MAG: membrane protein insertase YidC [Candidatus Omnitrophota bacterium]